MASGAPAAKQITVTNDGADTLEVNASSDSAQFVVSPASLSVAGGLSAVVNVTFTPPTLDLENATITLTHNALGGSHTIAASGTGSADLVFTPSADPIAVPLGLASLPTPLTVGSVLGGEAPYTFTERAPAVSWLDVSTAGDLSVASGETTPTTRGTYTMFLDISSANGQSLSTTVTVSVEGIRVYALAPTTVDDADLPATVTLTLSAPVSSLESVTLDGGAGAIVLTPTASVTGLPLDADIVIAAADIANGGSPVYGRYEVSVTEAGQALLPTQHALNITGEAWHAWDGVLALANGSESRTATFGAAVNTSNAYVPAEDIITPPAPSGAAAVYFTRDAYELQRDIIHVSSSLDTLTWEGEVVVPTGSAWTLSWPNSDAILGSYVSELTHPTGVVAMAPGGSVTFDSGTHPIAIRLAPVPTVLNMQLSSGWNLISIPGSATVSLDSLAPSDVVGIYGWDALAQQWVAVSGSTPLTPITDGYFALRAAVGFQSVPIAVDLNTVESSAATIRLEQGWTIVGVIFGGISASTLNLDPGRIFRWTGSSYEAVLEGETLLPFAGYWAFADVGAEIPVTQSNWVTPPAPSTQAVSAQPQPEWMASLSLNLPGGTSRTVEIGTHDAATPKHDRYDILQPPTVDAGATEFYASGAGLASRLTRSVEPARRGRTVWEIIASVAEAGASLSVRPDPLPPGYRLRVEEDSRPLDLSGGRDIQASQGSHRYLVFLSWQAPISTRLLANYPNPFNPETWIPFDLKAGASVVIHIYNATGARVRTLNLGYRDAGYYRDRADAAYWDGRNDAGERVASGVYSYELRAGGARSLRRMVIRK